MPRLCFSLEGCSNLSATPSKASRRNFSTIGAFCLSAFDGGGPRSTARRSRARVLGGDTTSGAHQGFLQLERVPATSNQLHIVSGLGFLSLRDSLTWACC